MPPDLSSANWKIDRAVELLHGLDGEVRKWFDTKPFSYYTYVSPEFKRASVIVKAASEPPIIQWSLIVADIIHNLRCALDYGFWAVLRDMFPGCIPPEGERLSFPIWDAPPNANQRKTIQKVSSKLLSAVESVQPYNHPFPSLPVRPLAIIRDIDNANKHRLLFTVMHSIAMINVRVSGLRKAHQGGHTDEPYRGEIKNGVEAAVTTFDVPEPYVKYECTQFASIIAIKHPVVDRLGRDRDDYAALIDILVAEVRRTIDDLVTAAA
jgi:hypothetical protein